MNAMGYGINELANDMQQLSQDAAKRNEILEKRIEEFLLDEQIDTYNLINKVAKLDGTGDQGMSMITLGNVNTLSVNTVPDLSISSNVGIDEVYN